MKLQPASKKMIRLIALGSLLGLVAMIAVFFVLHLLQLVKFDYTVITGGVAGTAVALLNFTLMCLTIQSAAQMEDKKQMKAKIQLSYNGRMFFQAAWVVAAFLMPWFHPVTAALPLLFPTVTIIVLRRSGKMIEPSQRKNEPEAEETE